MDTEPLADHVPPRYAVESDEEEDEINPLSKPSPPTTQEPTQITFETKGNITPGSPLLIASGDIGTFWAKGATELGEQAGGVYVNKVQPKGNKIGLVFTPVWTKATVIVSEALSRLTLTAMHPYAQGVLESFKPQSVAILDIYATPTYVTDTPIAFQDAPIRYLSTSDIEFPKNEAQTFAPPNLLQSTSASFLSILSVNSNVRGTVILVPSPHVSRPPPKEILPSNISHLAEDSVDWSSSVITLAQKLLFQSIGEENVGTTWKSHKGNEGGSMRALKRSTEVGEGAMYI